MQELQAEARLAAPSAAKPQEVLVAPLVQVERQVPAPVARLVRAARVRLSPLSATRVTSFLLGTRPIAQWSASATHCKLVATQYCACCLKVCIAAIRCHAIPATHRYPNGTATVMRTRIPATPNCCARNHTLYAGMGQMLAWMRLPRTPGAHQAAAEERKEIVVPPVARELMEPAAKAALPALPLATVVSAHHILIATQATSKWP
jgi:hypothetical protein